MAAALTMGNAELGTASEELARELHAVLASIDSSRWRAEMAYAMHERLDALSARIASLHERYAAGSVEVEPEEAPLRERLGEIAALLAEHMPDTEARGPSLKEEWVAFRAQVQPAYESWRRSLQAYRIHVPSLRPTNYTRNVFHVGMALICLLILEFAPDPMWCIGLAGGFTVWAWSAEFLRARSPKINALLMKMLGKVAHPHESHRVNSATWFTTALLVLALAESSVISAAALAVLGLGDPSAAIIGRRFGRTKLMHGRSLEGSLAFVLVAGLGAAAALSIFHPEIGVAAIAAIASSAALAGAVVEAVSLRIDDNFSVPLIAAGAAALVSWLLGLPL